MQEPFFLSGLSPVNGKWELLEIIGEGTYGEVFRGRDKKKNLAAIKVIENSANKHDEVQIEMSIFQRFSKHPNLVDYYGTFLFNNDHGVTTQIWLVMEYCEGGSVAELAKCVVQNDQVLSENVVKYILHQTLEGINFLHQNHVIHRDIKGPNILMTIEGRVKLIDYGVSANLPSTFARRHSSVGSPFWMAPEVIACEQQLDYNYDNRCDVWSLGITAIELADGEPPLAEEHPMKALFKIPRNPPPSVKNSKKWSTEFLEFISKAVTKDFEARPTANEMLKNKFLENCVTEELVLRKELMSLIHVVVKQYSNPSYDAKYQTLKAKQHNAKKNVKMLELADLATLPKLTEDIVLKYIAERYIADQIYTYIGEILLAVNPFKKLKIYGDGASLLYQDAQKENLPPHIYMIACTTYQAMIHKQHDQCCVISGESGSGKTVSANFLVHQFAAIGRSHGTNQINKTLVKKILQVNPLMEAFGNAQTVINQNSSRFGKYLELHFTHGGALVGAQLTQYLLEKSRVVSQPRGERNFHILYYMIAGLDFHKKLQDFELNTANKHRYLNTDELSLAECACTSEMQMKFTNVQQCFENLGFTKEEIQSLYCLLAAIIHLGDVDFIVDDVSYEGEKAKVFNTDTLDTVASLLCVNSDHLHEALITYSSVFRGETITRNNNVEQAMDCRDATAKALYGRLFCWIVKRINTLLRAEDKTNTLHKKIGILDIFGFENFTSNSFEQLLINIANEQLQFFFNEHVFVWEYEEYAAENVKGANVEFTNNKDILDLFLQKPVGILALLDEESRFPKASDLSLVEKFQDNIQSDNMRTSKETSTYFTVKHYAGKVTYDATGFLEKNRDTLSTDVMQILQESSDKTVSLLFHNVNAVNANNPTGKRNTNDSQYSTFATNRFQQTVSTHFRQQLRSLLSKVIKSDPHFVRCLRPNVQNSPNLFDQDKVLLQLQCTGVLETIQIRRQGFSDRIPFKDFVHRYKFLLHENIADVDETAEQCVRLLREAKIDDEETWKVGKTKVFLKYWHVDRLGNCIELYRNKVLICQKNIRKFLMRRKIKEFSMYRYVAASKIRAQWLAYVHRRRYLNMLQEQDQRHTELTGSFEDPAKTDIVLSSSDEETDEHDLLSVRPYYRNMKRERVGYLDYEDFVHSDEPASASFKMKFEQVAGEKAEKIEDAEGLAALEETRAIILLSQIDLASKEAFEMLNRTSYPVIKLVRAKAANGGVSRMKNQKLNIKDRMIAVVDGYGDPLQPKYRSAKLHLAESKKDTKKTQAEYKNSPMLGLVEKPTRITESIVEEDDDVSSKKSYSKPRRSNQKPPARQKAKEAQKLANKSAPLKKAAAAKSGKGIPSQNNPAKVSKSSGKRKDSLTGSSEQFYPSRMSNQTPQVKRDSDWFYPYEASHRVLQETEMIENRIRDVKRTEQHQPQQPRVREQQQPRVREFKYPSYLYGGKVDDYKPYNYLLNARTEQSKVIGHDINMSPVHKRRVVSSVTPYNNNIMWNPYANTIAPSIPVKPQKKSPTIYRPSPVIQHQHQHLRNDISRTSKENWAPRQNISIPSQNYPSYSELDDESYMENLPKRRRQFGFHYGLQQESMLQDLKLKKTGRLQELLVNK